MNEPAEVAFSTKFLLSIFVLHLGAKKIFHLVLTLTLVEGFFANFGSENIS
jgi:hypothetical protein